MICTLNTLKTFGGKHYYGNFANEFISTEDYLILPTTIKQYHKPLLAAFEVNVPGSTIFTKLNKLFI